MENDVTCSCGCGQFVTVKGQMKPAHELDDHFVYTIDGELDYIELFIAGHKPAALDNSAGVR